MFDSMSRDRVIPRRRRYWGHPPGTRLVVVFRPEPGRPHPRVARIEGEGVEIVVIPDPKLNAGAWNGADVPPVFVEVTVEVVESVGRGGRTLYIKKAA